MKSPLIDNKKKGGPFGPPSLENGMGIKKRKVRKKLRTKLERELESMVQNIKKQEENPDPSPGRCALCDRRIEYLFEEESHDHESCIKSAGRIMAKFGHGSDFDGKEFQLLICDGCFNNIKRRAVSYRFLNKGMGWIKIPRGKGG